MTIIQKLTRFVFNGYLGIAGQASNDRKLFGQPRTKEPFSDTLNFIYIILPKFNKTLEELEDDLDCWLYILK
ncbi:MAG: Rpn family recombination-promoting nuclease/putative transposase, partial [Planctomycetaceae bacterium]|nr:Rpn family recombination-promoting nuclease/putative transposase [Planctomycetaceae bacterium]